MTKQELASRLEEALARIDQLEQRLVAVETRPQYVPWQQWPPPVPYTSPFTCEPGNTWSPPFPRPVTICESAA